MVEGQHLFDQHALHRQLELVAQREQALGSGLQCGLVLNAQDHAARIALVQQLGRLQLGDDGVGQTVGHGVATLE
ncbi:hypothetical protein SDC9_116672 [bioreactor metagenome]|uniref:Uncharacterized protein n=1 Tax=bioreactor metagenome TaxID=1076179 RepID=A0A645C6Z5_9ZZZZ